MADVCTEAAGPGQANRYRFTLGNTAQVYFDTLDTSATGTINWTLTGPTGKLAYSYDAAGFPKGDGARSYTWRASGWLDSLTRDGLTDLGGGGDFLDTFVEAEREPARAIEA